MPKSEKTVDERPGFLDESLASEVVRALEERGVPQGTWLFDLARAREALREADAVLRRLEDAIVRASRPSELGGR